jgi:hypothetical protein
MQRIEQNIVTPTGDSKYFVADYTQNGSKTVFFIVRKEAEGVFEATLDGHPAIAITFGETKDGNAAWEIGHQLIEAWERVKKNAGDLR